MTTQQWSNAFNYYKLTLIPSAKYHLNKNVMKTEDTTIIGKNKKIDDDVDVKFNSSATSEDMSNLLDLLLNACDMLALRGFL